MKILIKIIFILIFSLEGWFLPRASFSASLASVILPMEIQPCTTNPRAVLIQVSTDKNAVCKYDMADQDYDRMANRFNITGETLHSSLVPSLSCSSSQNVFVRCWDETGDKNLESALIQIDISSSRPKALEKSGRYLKYNGQYKWLTGVDNQTLFADRKDKEFDVYEKLLYLAHYGVTAVRVWSECYWMFPNAYTPYSISKGKGDLDSWDSTYWAMIKKYVQRAEDFGIIVEIVLFSAYPGGKDGWVKKTIYNKENNINGVFSKNGNGHFWPHFYDLGLEENGKSMVRYQTALIDKYMKELGDYGNIIFSVANEYPGHTNNYDGTSIRSAYPWMQYMANYLKRKGGVVHVHANEFAGMNNKGIDYFKDQPYIDILNFHFYAKGADNINAISEFLKPLQLNEKVLMCDESFEFQEDEDTATREAWGSFMAGAYYLYYDSASHIGTQKWKNRIERVRVMTHIAKTIPWYNMTPLQCRETKYGDLIRNAPAKYWDILANPGNHYAVFMCSQTVDVETIIKLPAGSYNYVYYDTRLWNPKGIKGGNVISEGGYVGIPAPSANSWNGSSGLILIINRDK